MTVIKCNVCGRPILGIQASVTLAGGTVREHYDCHVNPLLAKARELGILDAREAQELAKRQAIEVELARQQAEADRAKVQAAEQAARDLARRNVEAETKRLAELTAKETARLKLEAQGSVAPGRFQQVAEELELGADDYAISARLKAEQEAAEKAKTDAESARLKALDPCVRCGKPGPHGEYHPRHCSACWNSQAPDAVTKKSIEIPTFNRPIELE